MTMTFPRVLQFRARCLLNLQTAESLEFYGVFSSINYKEDCESSLTFRMEKPLKNESSLWGNAGLQNLLYSRVLLGSRV